MTGPVVSSIDYNIEGHRICSGTFAAVYSIPQSTLNRIVFNVLKGDKEGVTYNDSRVSETRRDRPSLLAEATTWWRQRLRYYD
eukprot:1738426-Pleurochrysis_carterae.AAC.1